MKNQIPELLTCLKTGAYTSRHDSYGLRTPGSNTRAGDTHRRYTLFLWSELFRTAPRTRVAHLPSVGPRACSAETYPAFPRQSAAQMPGACSIP